VLRKTWELRHDQVVVGEKIGEGAFGDVHVGQLRINGAKEFDVAIKLVFDSQRDLNS
jgi:hypothetical protein